MKMDKDSTLESRSQERKNRITIDRVNLHDEKNHHSFHFHLSDSQSFELLAKMSQDEWETKTGLKATNSVDKSKVRWLTLDERYKQYEN